jgi:amino acid permease
MEDTTSEELLMEEHHASILQESHAPLSLVGPVANLCSATLGAGVLALPYALQQAGLVWGGILLLLAASSTLYSLQLLVEACRFFDTYTYEGIVQLALGKRARTITEVSILLFCGGCAVAYIITVGDIVESLSFNRNWAMLIVWIVAMLPLSLLRTMTSLQSASGVGIFSIFLLIAVANIHYWQDRHSHQKHQMTWSIILWPAHGMTSVCMACPLIIFAFSCQPNVCAIYHELAEKRNMPNVLLVAVSVCAVLYTSISLAAYMDFGPTVQPNVLQNYCVSFWLIQLAFVGMTIVSVCLVGIIIVFWNDAISNTFLLNIRLWSWLFHSIYFQHE